MKKSQAIQLFGCVGDAAAAIGVSSSAISQWPEDLPSRLQDRVIAALVRLDKPVPEWAKNAPVQEAE